MTLKLFKAILALSGVLLYLLLAWQVLQLDLPSAKDYQEGK